VAVVAAAVDVAVVAVAAVADGASVAAVAGVVVAVTVAVMAVVMAMSHQAATGVTACGFARNSDLNVNDAVRSGALRRTDRRHEAITG